MTGPNGHSHEDRAASLATAHADSTPPAAVRFSPDRVKELVAALEVPFDASQIEWRVMNTTKNGQPVRGQVVPYADQRAYTDRLNALFTPAGWTRKYAIHTSGNFERSQDKKIVAKVLVSCELTIFGLGSHSATGEEFADDPNALTAAEAQAFKRAAVCFGLGRYLYYFTGTWVDLDGCKRPKNIPELAGWATPEGWRRGLRPEQASDQRISEASFRNGECGQRSGKGTTARSDLIRSIQHMERVVGKRMYRGLLKSVARAWNPEDIQEARVQQRVLAHMRAAERGQSRAKVAGDKVGLSALVRVLGSMKLDTLEQVASLKTLQEIVVALEALAKQNE